MMIKADYIFYLIGILIIILARKDGNMISNDEERSRFFYFIELCVVVLATLTIMLRVFGFEFYF